jgi:Uma2 family endonuclease
MSAVVPVTAGRNDFAAVPIEPVVRFSVEQYHAMLASGILQSGDPVELLDGLLVPKMTKYPPHTISTKLTCRVFNSLLPAGWHVACQEPITLAGSEPEPDVAVVRGDPRDYRRGHPGAADVAVVVEISDATGPRDAVTKKRVYAAAGIPVYWIVNLPQRCVEVFSEPSGAAEPPDYRRRDVYAESDEAPLTVAGAAVGRVAVAGVLP